MDMLNIEDIKPMDEAVRILRETKGLYHVKVLNKHHRNMILGMENDNNIGVRECLSKRFCLLVTHNSATWEPEHEMVKKEGERIIFPALPFKELEQFNAISSSPTATVHKFLEGILGLEFGETEASLIIGFD